MWDGLRLTCEGMPTYIRYYFSTKMIAEGVNEKNS